MATTTNRRYSGISSIAVTDDAEKSHIYKIITLGNVGVGKSTLLASYCRGTTQLDLTQQSNVDCKILKKGQKLIQVSLWDTAGQERYDSITPNYYRGAHGCLLCFDITNEQSYADLITWHDKLKNHCDPVPPTILVGTKSDLRLSKQYIQTITSSTDCLLAARNLGLSYKEVSCYKQEMIEDVFDSVIDMVEAHRNSQLSPDGNKNVRLIVEKPPEKKGICKNMC